MQKNIVILVRYEYIPLILKFKSYFIFLFYHFYYIYVAMEDTFTLVKNNLKHTYIFH